MMSAAVLHGKRDVRIERVEVPQLGPGEVLVRVRAALTCGTDVKVYRRGYHARMIVRPALFGHEMSGTIEEVGQGVSLPLGLPVVAANSAPCGECEYCRIGRPALCEDLLFWNGAYAEFVRLPARVVAKNLLRLPEGFSFRRGAMVEPLACALRGVEDCAVQAGQSVAILGAGSLGLMLMQLAQRRGAQVVVAGRRREPLEKALRLGATAVVSAEEGDLGAQLIERSPDGRGFPVVIEAVGRSETTQAALAAVRKGGRVNLFGGCAAGTSLVIDAQRFHYQELSLVATFHHTPESFREAHRLVIDGAIDPEDYITGDVALTHLPAALDDIAEGRRTLKTAVSAE